MIVRACCCPQDAFYEFYRNTTAKKWGQAYLTKEFFKLIGERMSDKVTNSPPRPYLMHLTGEEPTPYSRLTTYVIDVSALVLRDEIRRLDVISTLLLNPGVARRVHLSAPYILCGRGRFFWSPPISKGSSWLER